MVMKLVFSLASFPPHRQWALSSKASSEMSPTLSTALGVSDGESDIKYEYSWCDSLNLFDNIYVRKQRV